MLEVDGSEGEGGGQVFRVAMALAAVTGVPVRITNIRAKRPRPGLRPQHLAGARALAELSEGRIHGIVEGGTTVEFEPGRIAGGEYAFGVDTAGSVTLILQTVLPAILAARDRFTITLEGGTDVPYAPTWDYFMNVHLPVLAELGYDVQAEHVKRGYFPAGGGRVLVETGPGAPRRTDFERRGSDVKIHGNVHSNGLPRHIAKRATDALRDAIVAGGFGLASVEEDVHRGPGTGMGVAAWATEGPRFLGADALGRRGVPAEAVGTACGEALVRELRAGGGLDPFQADQVLVPLALAGGGSFTTRILTGHARTVMALLPRFLPVTVDSWQEEAADAGDEDEADRLAHPPLTRVTVEPS